MAQADCHSILSEVGEKDRFINSLNSAKAIILVCVFTLQTENPCAKASATALYQAWELLGEAGAAQIALDKMRPAERTTAPVNMTVNSTPLDPIADTGREIIELGARLNELDARSSGQELTGSEKVYLESEMSDIGMREWTLRSFVSTRQAHSFDGALVQLAELLLILDRKKGLEESGEGKEDDSNARRLIFSLLSFVRTKCALDWPDNFLNLHMNPWRPYEECIPHEALETRS